MESQIKSIIINEIKALQKKINSEIDDVYSHMEENSIISFDNIKDKIILDKWNNFNSMLIGLRYWLIMFEKIFNYKYLGEEND